jgi:hypothetical protein
MGVSPGSVKQHLSRARQRLAAALGEPSLDLEVEPVNDLGARVDRLADAAADGIEPTRPDQTRASRHRWRSGPALVAAGGLVVIAAVTAAVLVGRDDGDDDVAVGGDGDGSAGQGSGAVVAVTYGDASLGTEPVDLELRFLDADGAVIAERSWSEVEQPTQGAPSEAVVMGGLVQRVPAGELSLDATLQPAGEPVSCTQPFTAAAGDRLILRLQLGSAAGADCAQVESVEDWVANRTGPTGVDYVGLTQAEADDRARAAGLTTRVVAADGMDLAVTMDFRPDRLNLMLFDGVVVAAQLDGEQAVRGPGHPRRRPRTGRGHVHRGLRRDPAVLRLRRQPALRTGVERVGDLHRDHRRPG